MIRARLEHYVAVTGTVYMLQVKYRKGTMVKVQIGSEVQMLLYEVAYIAVPTLSTAAKLRDEELEKV